MIHRQIEIPEIPTFSSCWTNRHQYDELIKRGYTLKFSKGQVTVTGNLVLAIFTGGKRVELIRKAHEALIKGVKK